MYIIVPGINAMLTGVIKDTLSQFILLIRKLRGYCKMMELSVKHSFYENFC